MMPRRAFILGGTVAAVVATAASIPNTPRNRLCIAANEFHDGYQQWAERMNATQAPGVIDSHAVQLWQSLPKQWRRVERMWHEWLKA
jgi:hypothetical protein